MLKTFIKLEKTMIYHLGECEKASLFSCFEEGYAQHRHQFMKALVTFLYTCNFEFQEIQCHRGMNVFMKSLTKIAFKGKGFQSVIEGHRYTDTRQLFLSSVMFLPATRIKRTMLKSTVIEYL